MRRSRAITLVLLSLLGIGGVSCCLWWNDDWTLGRSSRGYGGGYWGPRFYHSPGGSSHPHSTASPRGGFGHSAPSVGG